MRRKKRRRRRKRRRKRKKRKRKRKRRRRRMPKVVRCEITVIFFPPPRYDSDSTSQGKRWTSTNSNFSIDSLPFHMSAY